MSEWWTYRIRDFLLFTPETYYGMIEERNRSAWPLQIVMAAVALASTLSHRSHRLTRIFFVAFAIICAFVAWNFHLQRYADINFAAKWLAGGMFVQALLLLSASRGAEPATLSRDRLPGAFILIFAVVAQPLTGLLAGRSWMQLDYFGVAPDPTLVAILGFMLLVRPRPLLPLMIIPVILCLAGGGTLYAMRALDAGVSPFAAAIAVGTALATKRRRVSA